jgi:hypothetical protein
MIPEETGAVRHRGNLVQISEFFGRVIAAASCPDFPFAPVQPTFALEAKERGLATASVGRAARVRRRLPRVPRALTARRPRGLGAGQGALSE